MLKVIAAVDEEQGIGKNGEIPWDYPKDLQFFKFMTSGSKVIFGRKTFENIGVPLPNRETYVLSNQEQGVKNQNPYLKYTSLENFFLMDYGIQDEVYVCGGESIYEQFLPDVDGIILTRISDTYDCDMFFPEFEGDFQKCVDFEISDDLLVEKWL